MIGVLRRGTALFVVLALVAGFLSPVANAETKKFTKKRPAVAGMPISDPHSVAKALDRTRGAVALPAWVPDRATSVVATGRTQVDLDAPAGKSAVRVQRAAGAEKRASKAELNVHGRRLLAGGQSAVVLEVASDQAQPLEISVEASAAGIDPSRAQLFLVEGCDPVKNPSLAGCATTALPTSLDGTSATTTLTATPTAQMVVLAGGASGTNGDFSATPMSASATWSVGGSSGELSWANPLRVPPVASSLVPSLDLAYSSNAVDGRTSSANNQASWVGEGFELSSGGITRGYVPCSLDMTGSNTTTKTGDLCWNGDNLTASFAGHAGELVQIGTTGTYRFRADDGTRFVRKTAATNGVDQGEYWVMTTTDGTQYTFGNNVSSAWAVPVVGNHAGEPGHQASFAASFRTQAWAWRITEVKDTSNNVVKFSWATESNKYGKNNNTSGVATYTRGGYLTSIDYGFTATNSTASARVEFVVSDRCSGTVCGTEVANQANWPDVPLDLICSSATSCPTQVAPSYFSLKKLDKVITKVATAAGMTEVESWQFSYQWPTPGDGTRPSLWMSKIDHKVPGDTTVLTTTFAGMAMPNRVDSAQTGPGLTADPFNKYRITTITSEAGSQVVINYSPTECTTASVAAIVIDQNTSRCFPAKYHPAGYADSYTHWFHRYAVTQVTVHDLTGASSEPLVSTYSYGAPGWTFDDSPGSPEQDRTWNTFAGYATSTTILGPASGSPMRTTTTYYRGMHQDKLLAGGTKSVSVNGNGVADTDDWWKAGTAREVVVHNGASVVSRTVNTVGPLTTVATNAAGRTAGHQASATTQVLTTLATGGPRITESTETFDEFANVATIDDQGDAATTVDDRCTKVTVAVNTTAWLTQLPSHSQTRTGRCAAWPAATAETVIADTKYSYDGLAVGAVPLKGLLTSTQEAMSVTSGNIGYQVVTSKTYDAVGRVTGLVDAAGHKTTTSYSENAQKRPATFTVTSPDPDGAGPLTSHVITTTLDPIWAELTKQVGAGGETIEATIDAWGRTTQVWSALMSRTSFPSTPTTRYSYQWPGVNKPAGVKTEHYLSGPYRAETKLSDGLGRLREVQTETIDRYVNSSGGIITTAGRVVSGTRYDSRGLAIIESGGTMKSGAPSFVLSGTLDTEVASQSRVSYDGVGRVTNAKLYSFNTFKWTTASYVYGGDRVTVVPAQGAMPTTTISDARGNTTSVLNHRNTAMTGTPDEVTYIHTPAGQLKSMTDLAGNTWAYAYDMLGQVISVKDPNATAAATTTYDLRGMVASTTDANGNTFTNTYDPLGRLTSVKDGAGALVNSWTYDLVKKGYQDSETRYLPGGAQLINKVTQFTPGGDPIKTSTTVPTVAGQIESQLAGTYTTNYTYRYDGRITKAAHSAYGPIPAETMSYGYDTLGRVVGITGNTSYLGDVIWSALDEVKQTQQMNTSNQAAWFSHEYDQATGWNTRSYLDRQMLAGTDADIVYDRDQTGHLTRLSTTNTISGTNVDTQCFTRDHQERLTQAWTTSSTTCSTPTYSGPAPYRTSWTYDDSNNRSTQTKHTSPVAADSTVYSYPAAGGNNPHRLNTVTVTPSGSSTPISTNYTYDLAGNTTERWTGNAITSGGAFQKSTLTYDKQGRLATLTTAGQTISYLYDAGGGQLSRRDASKTTLYVGEVEMTLNRATGQVSAQRYYSFGGGTIAVRTGATNSTVSWVFSDLNNTAGWQLRSTDSAVTTRRTTPFGEARGTTTGWVGQEGFVGGIEDPVAGFTRLGARDYDTFAGRFLSIDPILDPSEPLHWNPYAYGYWDPSTNPDPSGLLPRLQDNCVDACGSEADRARHGMSPAPGQGVPAASPAPTVTPPPKANAKKPDTFADGFAKGAKSAAGDELKELDPRTLLTNAAQLFKTSITPSTVWSMIKGAVLDAIHFEELKGLISALTAGDEGSAGYWFGKLAVKVSVDVLEALVGAKVAKTVMKGINSGGKVAKTAAKSCSFTGATVVLMADGTRKPIQDIRPGDMVIATDPETGEQEPKAVEHVWVHDDTVLDLILDNDVISTTEDHPFWSVTDQRFERADQLDAGEKVLTATGQNVTVLGLAPRTQRQALAYNLSVEAIHTYHVGTADILVHNMCNVKIPGKTWRGPNAPATAFKHLQENHGLDPIVASNRLHVIKKRGGLGPADDVAIGRTGDVYDVRTGELLDSLTNKDLGNER